MRYKGDPYLLASCNFGEISSEQYKQELKELLTAQEVIDKMSPSGEADHERGSQHKQTKEQRGQIGLRSISILNYHSLPHV